MSNNRREFLKKSKAISLGAVLPFTSPYLGKNIFQSNADTLKVGLIGCGGRGTAAAGQALNADKNVHLTAMGDIFPDRLEKSYNALTDEYPDRVKVDASHKYIGKMFHGFSCLPL